MNGEECCGLWHCILLEHKEKFYQSAIKQELPVLDSWIDIEGGIGNLFANASLRRKFPNETFALDGESHNLSKGGTFMGQHILGA